MAPRETALLAGFGAEAVGGFASPTVVAAADDLVPWTARL